MARKLPHGLKPGFFGRRIDDVFVLFSSMDQAEKFKKYLSSKNPNINFSFLDINIYCEKGKFVANVVRKRSSVVSIVTSAVSYLKPIKPV